MLTIIVGLLMIGASIIATIIFAVVLGRTDLPRIAAWYLENWVGILLITPVFLLAASLTLLSLAPTEWIGGYSEVGVNTVDQIFALIALSYVALAIPGLVLGGWYERMKTPHHAS